MTWPRSAVEIALERAERVQAEQPAPAEEVASSASEEVAPEAPPLFPGASCAECRFGILREENWSNYTVEGVSFHCAVSLHPTPGFDAWYGEEPQLRYAERCFAYVLGRALRLDVDGEELVEASPAQQAMYRAWCGDI